MTTKNKLQKPPLCWRGGRSEERMKAAGDAQAGEDGGEDGNEQLDDEFPDFLVHGYSRPWMVSSFLITSMASACASREGTSWKVASLRRFLNSLPGSQITFTSFM